mmetsp:Transcript_33542/g.57515  ORF Transcript_33542/g.57515 Transcript_33542/m.57515 type:complete len:219 (+) Transcript_33542:167-823(+)
MLDLGLRHRNNDIVAHVVRLHVFHTQAVLHVLTATRLGVLVAEPHLIVCSAQHAHVGSYTPRWVFDLLRDVVEECDGRADKGMFHDGNSWWQLSQANEDLCLWVSKDCTDVCLQQRGLWNHVVIQQHRVISEALSDACVARQTSTFILWLHIDAHQVVWGPILQHCPHLVDMRRRWIVHHNQHVHRGLAVGHFELRNSLQHAHITAKGRNHNIEAVHE